MNRREFLAAGVAAAPLLAGRALPAGAAGPRGLALATADKESHVAVVRIRDGRVVRGIATREGPRSIERHVAGPAVVAHSTEGVVSLVDTDALAVRRVLHGFSEPRYTAISRGGELAYVTDSGTGELAVVDLVRARVVRRIAVGDSARHIARSPDGRRLWIPLGSSAARIAVVDVERAWHPRLLRHVRPPFLAHDVGFSPSGRRIWVTAGRERRLAVYAPGGATPLRTLGADAAPQHISFGPYFAYVASGNGASMTLYPLAGGRGRSVRVPLGSYNVQRGAGVVLTPSLGTGALTILDAHGRVLRSVEVAAAAHDACVIG